MVQRISSIKREVRLLRQVDDAYVRASHQLVIQQREMGAQEMMGSLEPERGPESLAELWTKSCWIWELLSSSRMSVSTKSSWMRDGRPHPGALVRG